MAGHMRLAVQHVPGFMTSTGFKPGSQEPAEARIMKFAKDENLDPENFWTAHHICKSNYKTSSGKTEAEKMADCNCYCW